ncbi:MAG: TonB-dependent receptor [Saprospiraceae bacterium]|nr:TonB-dependent receptor [Saprospiraceae bacterium]
MKRQHHYLAFLFLLIGCYSGIQAQTKFTLSGHIRDGSTGEELASATLFVKDLAQGNVTNVYGFYSITLPLGTYEVSYSYLGYDEVIHRIDLQRDIRMDVELMPSMQTMTEVVVVAEDADEHIKAVGMSTDKVDVEAVKKIPALMGEVDIIKAIQLLPGVKSIGEGTSGFYVRGGNADQNLVLLDEAPIYNASHVLGFFSAFNPDAIKDMELYKGAMPARFGGRLSSVLDIRMKEGNSKKFGGSAGIGTLMSRLSLEAPIGTSGSFILSGRRSYLDVLARPFMKNSEDDFTFYFYDINAKGNYRINENNRLFVSGYFGRDVLVVPADNFDVRWGNKTGTVRWNHIFSPKLFANFTTYYSQYDYGLLIDDLQKFSWNAVLEEVSMKADFSAYPNPNTALEFGGQIIRHHIQPGKIRVEDTENAISEVTIEEANSIESAAYVSVEINATPKLTTQIGLRVSSLHNIGPHTHYATNSNAEILDSSTYGKGAYHSDYNLEPRFGLNYKMSSRASLKMSYNRTAQYIQQASNGNTATPFDVWFTASPNVKPQLADQLALGYFRNFSNNAFEASIEAYYKDFERAIDFREGASLLLNQNLEGELRVGKARAYGIEFMIRKDAGRLTGWLNYTYSKVEKRIPEINKGNWYNAKYDKPHDLAIVLSYQLKPRITLSTNFIYSSGGATTYPTGKYEYYGSIVPVFSARNGARLPHYHRLDISMTLTARKNEDRRMQSEWVFSIYNAYHRKNAFAINFKQDEQNPSRTYAERSALFGIVPAVTYNIKF